MERFIIEIAFLALLALLSWGRGMGRRGREGARKRFIIEIALLALLAFLSWGWGVGRRGGERREERCRFCGLEKKQ